MTVISEIYQIMFIASIIIILYVVGNGVIKSYAKFKLGVDTKIVLPKETKIILLTAIAIFISYLTSPNI